jgi:hypothetical protein
MPPSLYHINTTALSRRYGTTIYDQQTGRNPLDPRWAVLILFVFWGLCTTVKTRERVKYLHWRSDGKIQCSTSSACAVHAALKYITSQEILSRDLTVDDILMVHKLMMANATKMTVPFTLSFRNVNVRASEHSNPRIRMHLTACEIIVARFNSFRNGECVGTQKNALSRGCTRSSTTWLRCIHLPMEMGDCWLLLPYALRRWIPFCIPLSSHHKKIQETLHASSNPRVQIYRKHGIWIILFLQYELPIRDAKLLLDNLWVSE